MLANAPDRSTRPEARPLPLAELPRDTSPSPSALPERAPPPTAPARIAVLAGPNAPTASVRPALRPRAALAQRPSAAVIAIAPGTSALAVPRSLRPALRPGDLARPRTTSASAAPTVQRGRLCGQRGLAGDRLARISTGTGGCGIAEPILLREVDGIALSSPATINCDTARALQQWVRQSLVPEVGRYGGGVRSLRVVASYACRTRNSQPGARLSEHARGNAIDIAGIGLADGTELTVLTDWRTRREGRILRDVHRGACGPFGTVLGPESDRFHRDHFHFDVARHRGGPFCR